MKLCFVISIVIFVFIGCAEVDETPPSVISINIGEGMEITPPYDIVINFDEDINANAIYGIQIPGIVTMPQVIGKSTISVKIAGKIKPGRYTLIISGILDLAGNEMESDKTINFIIPSQTQDEIVNSDEELAKKYSQAVDYTNPITRDYAAQLAALQPGEYNINQVCEIYDYLYENWRYVSDPWGVDYVSPASRTIQANLVGDCDDFAVLMAAVIAAIGGTTHIIVAWNKEVGHAYAEVFAGDEANIKELVEFISARYKLWGESINYHIETSGKCWLNLDWTAKFPGGPFFSADREIAIALNGTYKIYKH